MNLANKNLRLFLAAIVLIGIGALIGYALFHKGSRPTAKSNPGKVTINDSSAGLSFNMSNNFQPIPRNELAVFNSGVLYGYRVADDKNAKCVISQTATGKVTAGELRDGVFAEIKKNHTDAHLDSSGIVQVGTGRGVLLQISYTDNDQKIKRAEIAAVGNPNITFAFCQSLAADNAKYYDDFTTFFSSLKLTK